MELIDKQKLLEWLNRNIEANKLSQGGIALKILREQVKSVSFDDHSAQEEIAKLKEDRDSWRRVSERLEREKIQAEQELKEALEGLKWYADESNYAYAKGEVSVFSTILTEGGVMARAIIAKIEGGQL